VTVRFEPSGREVQVARGTSLFEAARRAGLPVAGACDRSAACGRCGMRVLECGSGIQRESDRERIVKARNRVDEAVRLSCVYSVRSDVTVTTSYW
jgi:ferredoxin